MKSGPVLLGLDLIKALDIVIRGNRVIIKAEQKVREISAVPPPPATTAPPTPAMDYVNNFVHCYMCDM